MLGIANKIYNGVTDQRVFRLLVLVSIPVIYTQLIGGIHDSLAGIDSQLQRIGHDIEDVETRIRNGIRLAEMERDDAFWEKICSIESNTSCSCQKLIGINANVNQLVGDVVRIKGNVNQLVGQVDRVETNVEVNGSFIVDLVAKTNLIHRNTKELIAR